MTYDEIYGMDLDNYCLAHGTTIEDLISKTELDIEILTTRMQEEFPRGSMTFTPLASEIYKLIRKKKNHVTRLKEWKADSDYKASQTSSEV